jgi:DNA-binding transcriptional ArsR family regulator
LVTDRGAGGCGLACAAAAPPSLPKATMSNHYNVLRSAGLIRSERRGVEVMNAPRCAEIEARFPGVVSAVLAADDFAGAA